MIGKFPRLSDPGPRLANSLALHYATFGKSMPIDRVQLDPFREQHTETRPRPEKCPIERRYFMPRLALDWEQL